MASQLERAIAEVRAGTLTVVKLWGKSIGDAGATQLADALGTNTSVKELYLQQNSIGEAGATQLADALRTNTSVEVLYLDGNNSIGEELRLRIKALLAPAARAQRKAEATPVAVPAPEAPEWGGAAAGGSEPLAGAVAAAVACAAPPAAPPASAVSAGAGGDGSSSSSSDDDDEDRPSKIKVARRDDGLE